MVFLRYFKCQLFHLRAFFQKLICCQIPLRYLNTVNFPHPIGIVISSQAKIGKNVTIYQNVTIGGHDRSAYKSEDYPTICDNVIIYAGAIVVGGIRIGKNVIVGANTVVTQDVPDNSIVVGVNQVKQKVNFISSINDSEYCQNY
jgi:serine acetyltransferase